MKPENKNIEVPKEEVAEQEPATRDGHEESAEQAPEATAEGEPEAVAGATATDNSPPAVSIAEPVDEVEQADVAEDAETDDDTEAAVTYENGRPLVHELQYQVPKSKNAATADEEEPAEVKFSSVSEAKAVIEGFLFSCNEPLSVSRISKLMSNLHPKTVRGLLLELQWEYENRPGGLQVVEIAGGYQMSTRAFVAPWMFRMHKHKRRSALSPATLETLAIVAYRQPITKGEIEAIRGVESGAPLRTLQELNMVEASGRREVIGRPQLYITTEQFLKSFGLKSVGDLPSISELKNRFAEEQKLKPVMAAEPAKVDEAPAKEEQDPNDVKDVNDQVERDDDDMDGVEVAIADNEAEESGNPHEYEELASEQDDDDLEGNVGGDELDEQDDQVLDGEINEDATMDDDPDKENQ